MGGGESVFGTYAAEAELVALEWPRREWPIDGPSDGPSEGPWETPRDGALAGNVVDEVTVMAGNPKPPGLLGVWAGVWMGERYGELEREWTGEWDGEWYGECGAPAS